MRLTLILLVICGLVFWALWMRLGKAFPERKWRARAIVGVPYWLLLMPTFMAVLIPGLRMGTPQWLSVTSIVALFFAMVYGIFLCAFGLPVFALQRVRQLRGREPDEDRRRFLQRAALVPPAVIIVASGAGAIGAMAEPVVRRIRLDTPRDMTGLHGLKIVQFSDVHIGRFARRDQLARIVEIINAQGPDIVVCTGDLLDHSMEQLDDAQFMLRGVKHKHGAFMCLGNHEYYSAGSDPSDLIAGVEEAGTVMLRDASMRVSVGGDHLWMLGVDYPGRRQPKDSFDHALAEVADDGAPRIVLAHNPKSFWEGRTRDIDLMLAGHTHGGQVSLGRIGQYELSPVLPVELYHAGEYEHEGRRLYVNSGTGAWMPVRLNCPPEITVVELV